MQKLSTKQFLKHQTLQLMTLLLKSLVDEEQAAQITTENVMAQLGKRTYYKEQRTGEIHLGLCYKQIRKEVKKNPHVTMEQLKLIHKLG